MSQSAVVVVEGRTYTLTIELSDLPQSPKVGIVEDGRGAGWCRWSLTGCCLLVETLRLDPGYNGPLNDGGEAGSLLWRISEALNNTGLPLRWR